MENRSSDDDNRNVYKSGKFDDEPWSYIQTSDIHRPNAHLMDETPGLYPNTPLTSDRMTDQHDFRIHPKNVANNGSI